MRRRATYRGPAGRPGRYRGRLLALAAVGLAAVALSSACESPPERVPEPYLPTSAHDAYAHSLRQAGLESTALGRGWIESADRALEQPVSVESPFREIGWFDPGRPESAGYRFRVEGGQRVEIDIDLDADQPARLFIDLFRVPSQPDGAPVHVATAAGGDRRLELEVLEGADYVVRVQPELLRGGRFTVTIRNVAALEFPVEGHGASAVWSSFGAPRDGGRRSHRGVDIFAPRGTPALAAADAVVTRVGQQRLGGNVIWLRTVSGGYRLYYAHLDSQDVVDGQRVRAGEPIGRVGNTGNARTTPPHLHFGVYLGRRGDQRRRRGAVDPMPFIRPVDATPPEVLADATLLGSFARSISGDIELRRGPERRATVLKPLDRHVPVRLEAASHSSYRVRLPDGTIGYLPSRSLEPVDEAVEQTALSGSGAVRTLPRPDAAVLDELSPGIPVIVLGRFGIWSWVSTPAGRTGWLETGG